MTKDINEGSYVDKYGDTQLTFVLPNGETNPLDGKNIPKEEADAKEAKKQAKIQKELNKNPNRVEGGKKAHITKKENIKKELQDRPIFKILGYNPITNQEEGKKDMNDNNSLVESILEAVSETMMEKYGYVDEGILDTIKEKAKKLFGKPSHHDIAREILNRQRSKKEEPKEEGTKQLGTTKKEPLLLTSKKEPLLLTTTKPRRGRPKGSKNKPKPETTKGIKVIHKDRYPSQDKPAKAVTEVKPNDIKEPIKAKNNSGVTSAPKAAEKTEKTITLLHDKDKAPKVQRAKNGRVSVGQVATAGSNVLSSRTNAYRQAVANGVSGDELSKLYWRKAQAESASKLPRTRRPAAEVREQTAKNLLKYEKMSSKLHDKNNMFSKNYVYNPKKNAQYRNASNKRTSNHTKLLAFTPNNTYALANRIASNESLSESTKQSILNLIESYLPEDLNKIRRLKETIDSYKKEMASFPHNSQSIREKIKQAQAELKRAKEEHRMSNHREMF